VAAVGTGSRDGGGHYFTDLPSAPSRPGAVDLSLPDLTATLRTDRGVFAADRLDAGTKLLLVETGVRPEAAGADWPDGDLVDLGCGYGPIAVALSMRHPDRTVWAVDVNERARELCALNADAAGVGDRVRVVAPGAVPDDVGVAALFSNPPIRIGKPALHDLLDTWLGRLVPGAEAWLVVQKHLGADSLAAGVKDSGHGVERVCSRRGYRLLRVTTRGRSGQPDGVHPQT